MLATPEEFRNVGRQPRDRLGLGEIDSGGVFPSKCLLKRQAHYHKETAMLGDLIAEEIGQTTYIKVLPTENGTIKTEICFQAQGTIVGTQCQDIGTYISVGRPDGTTYGEGQGLIMTVDGDTVTWNGQGTSVSLIALDS